MQKSDHQTRMVEGVPDSGNLAFPEAGDDDISGSALSTFRAKEEEIERRRIEVRERFQLQLDRVEEESKRLAMIREFLQSVDPIKDEDVVLGQYEGYKDDPTVPKDSNTTTLAILVLRVNSERWEGVPFVPKAGKALNSRKAEIRVLFKDVPGDIFKYLGSSFWGMAAVLASTNLLTARIAAGYLGVALLIVLFIAENWTLRGLCMGFIVFLAGIWVLQEKTEVRILRYVVLFIGVMNSLFSVYGNTCKFLCFGQQGMHK